MKFVLISVFLLTAAVGASSAQTQADCEFHCVPCGENKVCDAIYQACLDKCRTGSGHLGTPSRPDVWGAVAVSPSTLLEGHSWNSKSEQDASKRALKECQAASKAGDCTVVVKVADLCVSLAISKPEKVYAVGGPTGAITNANSNAMLRCERAGGRSCEVVTAFCADGVRHEAGRAPAPIGRGK